jgi:hypothetical protein
LLNVSKYPLSRQYGFRLSQAPNFSSYDMLTGLRKSGFFSRGRFGAALGCALSAAAFFAAVLTAAGLAAAGLAAGFAFVPAAFTAPGLAVGFAFVPVVFTAFVLAADLTAGLTGLGFLGITVNSISFPQ